ncbi:MAG: Tfp pilus assembly protein PilF/formate-dependent nitrite reductase cytochrome c552 subunit [Flavobacterium sp.]|jgi:Tfp pilus assembly protein PilF/formate-dependent nitrite reductase cytochrome c552 subunit
MLMKMNKCLKYFLAIVCAVALCAMFFVEIWDAENNLATEEKEQVKFTITETQASKNGGIAHAEYIGSDTCANCHQTQYEDWRHSHHDQAMQHASKETIKGDFSNVTFTVLAQDSVFYKKEGKFFVRTAGPGGEPSDYEIAYTFGASPLQQYIVNFPDGKLQMLPIAWDTLESRWFHLQESQKPQHNEWIYWTNGGQNWNSMCADCHTTNLKKGYDKDQQTYSTTWSAIDVGCEACHGPGSKHIVAVKNKNYQAGTTDPEIDMEKGENSQVLVDKCGRCHSRRQQLTSVFAHDSDNLLDHYLPAVLQPGLYHSDGQIREEVFVYGSFIQSKMYHNDVSCIDCHEPHSVRLKASGNALCISCHIKDQYDTPGHHHHQANVGGELLDLERSEGNQCVDCHMPGRIYMGNDFRRDHSLRVPRPDLSVKYNTPNACSSCHQEEGAQWAANKIENWFGKHRAPHFSETLAFSEAQPESAIEPLLNLLEDETQPAIARATAAYILSPLNYLSGVRDAMNEALTNKAPLIRSQAAGAFFELPLEEKLQPLSALLQDPVRAVRITAARGLVEVRRSQIPKALRIAFDLAKTEYHNSLAINADFASGRVQIALDYQKKGQLALAEKAYLSALEIDKHFNVARINLAQLYYLQQRLVEADKLYRTIIEQEPAATSAHYALGLLKAEQGEYEAAATFLEAAGNSGNHPRAWYNLAVLRHQQGKIQMAEQAYLKALAFSPFNPDFLNGLLILYIQQQQWQKANYLIKNRLEKRPGDNFLLRLKSTVERAQYQAALSP